MSVRNTFKCLLLFLLVIIFTATVFLAANKPTKSSERVQKKLPSTGMPLQPYQTIIIPHTKDQVTASRIREENRLHLEMHTSPMFNPPPSGYRYEVWWGTTLEKESRYVFAGFLEREKDQTWKLVGFPVEDSRHTLNQVLVFTAPLDESWKMADHPPPLTAPNHTFLFSGDFPYVVQP